MSKPLSFEELQKKLTENLVKNHQYEKATNVAIFDASKIPLPKGITNESIPLHVNFFNSLTGAAEEATAQITRDLWEKNNDHLNTDGTLQFDGLHFNTSHVLKQQVGDADLFGASTSILDFQFTQECSDWLAQSRSTNEELAASLFKK